MNFVSYVFASIQTLLSLIIQEYFVLLPQCFCCGMKASSHQHIDSSMTLNHVFQFYFAFGLPLSGHKINTLFLILQISYCSKKYWLFILRHIIHKLDTNHKSACIGKRGHFSHSQVTKKEKKRKKRIACIYVHFHK